MEFSWRIVVGTLIGILGAAFGSVGGVGGKRKFVQTFFLAPQEKGYFVMNDMFHYIDDEVTYPNLVPVASETIDTQPHLSASLAEPPGKLIAELCFHDICF